MADNVTISGDKITLREVAADKVTIREVAADTVVIREVGAQGIKGDTGMSAYQVWLAAGNSGSEADFLASLKGDPGEAATTYEHSQMIPLNTWTITHNLDRFPSVTVVDSAGETVVGDVVYVSGSTVIISFSAAFSGKAYLN